ncbi:tetratricopeptide repeat protein [Candidatus Parcubacteria bacterium]|nr:tetratricopeptide repeat protein [Candidatus Parcubacteria bacterium]
MMYNIIPFIIAVISLIIILIIVIKKFSILSSIDVNSTIEEKESKLKEKIVISRVKRRFNILANLKYFTAVKQRILGFLNRIKLFHRKLLELENRYKFRIKSIKEKRRDNIETENLEIDAILKNGQKLFNENNFELAEKKYIEAIKFDPHNMEAYQGLGKIYLQLKQYSQAEEIFKHIIKIDENNSDAFFNLGMINFNENRFDLARENYLKASKLEKHNALILSNLAEACKALDYNEEAASYLKEAINIEPNNPRYLDSLTEISIILKDKNLAENILKKLQEVNPDNMKIKEYKNKIDLLRN